jgi:hypothetical protein
MFRSALAQQGPEGLVTIEVGPERKPYVVYRELLTCHSDYFAACLNDKDTVWKEAEDRRVVLDDVETYAFDIFVNWIYGSKRPVKHLYDTGQCQEHNFDRVFCGMVGAYALCDRLFVRTNLKSAISIPLVDYILQHTPTESWTAQHVKYAFDMLPEQSLVLQLIADADCALVYSPDAERSKHSFAMGKKEGDLPDDFWARVIKRDADKKHRSKALKWDYYEKA